MRKDLYRDLHIVGLGMLFCAAFGVSATAPGKAPLHVSFDRLPEKMTEDNCISKLNTSSRLNDIHKAAQKGDTATVETLLRHNASRVNEQDAYRKTPLHWGAWAGKKEVVELLLRYGADVTAVDKERRTPLHWGAWAGKKEVVELLLRYGADVTAVDKNGRTPLHWGAWIGAKELVELLLEHKADPEVTDTNGYTPRGLAVQRKHSELGAVLEQEEKRMEAERRRAREIEMQGRRGRLDMPELEDMDIEPGY